MSGGVVATDRDGLAIARVIARKGKLAAPRSYAGSFWHVVAQSAAEFGFVRE